MLAQRPVKLFLLIVLIVGFFPVIGWAGGPNLLTDEDMDGIYAQGFSAQLNFDINIVLPGGNTLSVPPFTIPDFSMPGNLGGTSGNITSVASPSNNSTVPDSVPNNTSQTGTNQTTPATVSGANTSSPVNATSPVYQSGYPGAGIQISDSAMQGNSGMIINAPNSAVSMSISVVVLNNSTVAGNIIQSSQSYPTNLFVSLKSFIH
jgi:hypothetical protein